MAPQTDLVEGRSEEKQNLQDTENLLESRPEDLKRPQVAHLQELGKDPSLPPSECPSLSFDTSRSLSSPDVDRGWAYVVFVAAYLYYFVSSGMYYSFSVFFVEFLTAFNESRGKTGWVYSTNSAVHMFSGPISGWVVMRWGPRAAVMLGGLLAGLGNFLTAFAPNLDVIFFTQGFINALGTSLNFSGWVVGLSRFFEKRHSLAAGLAMSGSGCGVFFLGPFMKTIVSEFGWRGGMIICAGLSLNMCVFGATIYGKLRPPPGTQNVTERIEIIEDKASIPEKESGDLLLGEKRDFKEDETRASWDSEKPLPETLALPSLVAAGSIWSLAETRRKREHGERLRNMVMSAKRQFTSPRSHDYSPEIDVHDGSERGETRRLFCSVTFWLLEASCFLSFMATTTVFAVFLDWTKWAGLSASFPQALAGNGAGDMVGRMLAGVLMGRRIPPLLLFSATQLLLGLTVGSAALASTHGQLVAAMVGFGVACGLQSVLQALMPSQMSSGVGVARVLGYLLLVTGAGALSGPPIAGALVDLTNSYTSVLILCTAAPVAAAALNLAAYFTSRYSSSSVMRRGTLSTNTKSSSSTINKFTVDDLGESSLPHIVCDKNNK